MDAVSIANVNTNTNTNGNSGGSNGVSGSSSGIGGSNGSSGFYGEPNNTSSHSTSMPTQQLPPPQYSYATYPAGYSNKISNANATTPNASWNQMSGMQPAYSQPQQQPQMQYIPPQPQPQQPLPQQQQSPPQQQYTQHPYSQPQQPPPQSSPQLGYQYNFTPPLPSSSSVGPPGGHNNIHNPPTNGGGAATGGGGQYPLSTPSNASLPGYHPHYQPPGGGQGLGGMSGYQLSGYPHASMIQQGTVLGQGPGQGSGQIHTSSIATPFFGASVPANTTSLQQVCKTMSSTHIITYSTSLLANPMTLHRILCLST